MKLRSWIVSLLLGLLLWSGFMGSSSANPPVVDSPRLTIAASPSPNQSAAVLHVLNRLSFGARPGDVDRVTQMGIETYIQSQLSPSTIALDPNLTQQLSQLETLNMSPPELVRNYQPPQVGRGKLSQEAMRAARQKSRRVMQQALEAKLMRSVSSPRQLEEVMADFWYNHFNVFGGKGLTRVWTGAYEQQAIRPYALGRFRELLGATSRHPAMLFYLDNWQNTAPNSKGARGRFKGLNENYARELMELHTLGVNGGYTQQDVIALAKIFTGVATGKG